MKYISLLIFLLTGIVFIRWKYAARTSEPEQVDKDKKERIDEQE